MQVHILGGGVAGLSCALALVRRANFTNIQVFEQAADLQLPHRMGHGLMLMQNGVRALHALQAGHLLDGCNPIKQAIFRDEQGHIVHTETLNQVYCMTRSSLVQGLRGELPRDTLKFNHACQSVELALANITGFIPYKSLRAENMRVKQVHWQHGKSLISKPGDLIIGAEGWRSPLCYALNPTLQRPVSRVREIVTSTEMPDLAAQLGSRFIKTQMKDRGIAFGLLAPTPSRVIGFLQFDSERYRSFPGRHATANDIRQFLEGILTDVPEPIPTYLRRADLTHAHVWHPINADLPAVLHGHNAVVVGDAAHPMLPFSSQGVSAALEDAVLLADRLRAQPQLAMTLPETLAHFCQQRRQQLLPYLEGGREILANFLTPSASLIPSYVKAVEAAERIEDRKTPPLNSLNHLNSLIPQQKKIPRITSSLVH